MGLKSKFLKVETRFIGETKYACIHLKMYIRKRGYVRAQYNIVGKRKKWIEHYAIYTYDNCQS